MIIESVIQIVRLSVKMGINGRIRSSPPQCRGNASKGSGLRIRESRQIDEGRWACVTEAWGQIEPMRVEKAWIVVRGHSDVCPFAVSVVVETSLSLIQATEGKTGRERAEGFKEKCHEVGKSGYAH